VETSISNWLNYVKFSPARERLQLSFPNRSDFGYFCFVTNTEMVSEKVVNAFDKSGNAESYINTMRVYRKGKHDWYAPSQGEKEYI